MTIRDDLIKALARADEARNKANREWNEAAKAKVKADLDYDVADRDYHHIRYQIEKIDGKPYWEAGQ